MEIFVNDGNLCLFCEYQFYLSPALPVSECKIDYHESKLQKIRSHLILPMVNEFALKIKTVVDALALVFEKEK